MPDLTPRTFAWVGILVLAAVTAVAIGSFACKPREAEPPSILFVTIDTLRADHCSLYGYARPANPHAPAHHTDALRSIQVELANQPGDLHRRTLVQLDVVQQLLRSFEAESAPGFDFERAGLIFPALADDEVAVLGAAVDGNELRIFWNLRFLSCCDGSH